VGEFPDAGAISFAAPPSARPPAPPAVAAVTVERIQRPVEEEMENVRQALMDVVGDRHPMLLAAADQIFGAGGKRVRPLICLLIAQATIELYGTEMTLEHRRLAMISEMIHTASLVHDDVLDECDLRRGKTTIHNLFGTRVAVLAGDFLFAQSSWFLANLDNLEVIKLISQVIADFADGEIAQAASLYNLDLTVEEYLDKSFYKTASLIAASCRSAAVFSGSTEAVKDAMYEYGRRLGLAFQVVDDILDFTQTTEQLGKPQGQDLASGNLTAPAIYALRRSPRLRELVEGRLDDQASLDLALQLVQAEGGIEEARALAFREGQAALDALECLPDGQAKESLGLMVDYVLCRLS